MVSERIKQVREKLDEAVTKAKATPRERCIAIAVLRRNWSRWAFHTEIAGERRSTWISNTETGRKVTIEYAYENSITANSIWIATKLISEVQSDATLHIDR